MIITDSKRHFYDAIKFEHVLLLVNCDVDALCATRILQTLFFYDHVRYILEPVQGLHDLRRAVSDHCAGQIRIVVLINCGNAFDICEVLYAYEHLIFYIIDSYRPVNLSALFDRSTSYERVHCLMSEEDCTQQNNLLPADDHLVSILSTENEENDDDDDDENHSLNAENFSQSSRNKRLWKESKTNYYKYSFYGDSSSILLYNLAWKMSRDTVQLLWLAIVGLSEQLLLGRISRDRYTLNITDLTQHAIRLNHSIASNEKVSMDCMRINFIENDLLLLTYRRWSLFDALQMSPISSCAFYTWQRNQDFNKNKNSINSFLVDLGIPILESRQIFSAMPNEIQKNIRPLVSEWVEKMTKKLQRSHMMQDCIVPSFELRLGFAKLFGAFDALCSLEALLEFGDPKSSECSFSKRFLSALDALSGKLTDTLERGIAQMQNILRWQFGRLTTLLSPIQVSSAGPFLLVTLSPEAESNLQPMVLINLARFVLKAYYCENFRSSKREQIARMPLLVIVPIASLSKENNMQHQQQSSSEWLRCVWVPSVSKESEPRSCFLFLFNKILSKMEGSLRQMFFNVNICDVRAENKLQFLENLTTAADDSYT